MQICRSAEPIAIIIPMYNESLNLKTCINNLQLQTSQNFKIYFIDDGSTDNTVNILKKLLIDTTFPFVILQQENQGAAQARLNGITNCKEKYCMTLDCDDYLSNNTILEIQNLINEQNKNIDIIIYDLMIQDQKGVFTQFPFFDINRTQLKGSECLKYTFGDWQVSGIMCAKKEVFLKSYQTYFNFNKKQSNFINNDEVITRLNFLYSKNVFRIPAQYFYCFNQNSTTKKINTNFYKIIENSIIIHKIFFKEIPSNILNDEVYFVLNGMKSYYSHNLDKITNKQEWLLMFKKSLCYIIKNKLYKTYTKDQKIKIIKLFIFTYLNLL